MFLITFRHTIGRYAFIGAGAVVTLDVADHALALVDVPVGRSARLCGSESHVHGMRWRVSR